MKNQKLESQEMSSSHTLEAGFLKFIEEKGTDIVKTSEELKQLKDEELNQQRQKHQLQAIKSSLEVVLMQKEEDFQRCRGGLTQMQKNVFDQIFPIVEDIYHQELLSMELTQQLQLKQISKDVGHICSKITQESSFHQDASSDVLWSWFREMKEYEDRYGINSNFSINDEIPDCHFFHPRYREIKSSGKVQLMFSTRYKEFCLHVDITHERNLPGEVNCMPYKILSDFAIGSLALGANKSLLKGDKAHKFVEEIVWPSLDDIR